MAKRKTLYMETTEVPAERTAGEIIGLLAAAGARQITHEYTGHEIAGLRFVLEAMEQVFEYRLPVRVEPVFLILNGRRKGYSRERFADHDREQAKRTAWRHCLRWLQSQLAFIETGQAAVTEVFLANLLLRDKDGRIKTTHEQFLEDAQKQIAAPGGP